MRARRPSRVPLPPYCYWAAPGLLLCRGLRAADGGGRFLGQPLGCLLRSWQARRCAAWPVSREMRPRRLRPALVFLVSYRPLARSRHPLTCAFARASPRGRGAHTPPPRPGRTTCARGPVARGQRGAATSPRAEPRRKKRLRRANWKEPQHLHSAAPLGVSEKRLPTSGEFISDPSRFMRSAVSVCNRAPKLGICIDCLWGPR